MNGILCIDKPAGLTSMSAIQRVKRTLGLRKLGHSGTLDPAATGLLVVALGNATRLLPYLDLEPKQYEFGVQFGATTDTLDAQGAVEQDGGPVPSRDQLLKALDRFRGEIEQVPPRFSAVKVHGARAYKLARGNQDFELKARTIRVFDLQLSNYDDVAGEAHLSLTCSGGTYVRSLARDLGQSLETLAYASSIRRTTMGMFSVEGAPGTDAAAEELRAGVRPLGEVLAGRPSLVASQEQELELAHGRDISTNGSAQTEKYLYVFNRGNDLIAVTQMISKGKYHPVRVFGVS